MLEKVNRREGSQETFYPSGHSPDKARIEMSGYILSTEGEGRKSRSSSRQLDYKPRTLSPTCLCLSSYLASSFVSIYITRAPALPPPTLCWASSQLSNIRAISALDSSQFPKASLRPIKCHLLDCKGTKCTADTARSPSSLPSQETLNLPFASFWPSFSQLLPEHTYVLLRQCHTTVLTFHKSYTFPLHWWPLKIPFFRCLAESMLNSDADLPRADKNKDLFSLQFLGRKLFSTLLFRKEAEIIVNLSISVILKGWAVDPQTMM